MPKGKTILITGAASGLGRAWSEGFLAEGAMVVAADIDTIGLKSLKKIGAHCIETDVSNSKDVETMVDFAITATGRLDVLFNNAGVGFVTRIEDLRDDQFENHVAIHLFGTVNGMRYAIPHMRRAGYGRIVNTISRGAEFATARNSAYSAAKAAIWAATRSAAEEVEEANILINMLIPGPTNTAIWGRDMPDLQGPQVTYPTAKMLATLPADGPRGKVFWNEQEYRLFSPENQRPRSRSE
ncbi:MAG: SDR family NAD(P)-dependent oxidoreductase [Gammaproteobacteria bacterium]|nr:SDR family NAD(P)-dependent oxidoreductase [Gammaproteobacteria bacterium]